MAIWNVCVSSFSTDSTSGYTSHRVTVATSPGDAVSNLLVNNTTADPNGYFYINTNVVNISWNCPDQGDKVFKSLNISPWIPGQNNTILPFTGWANITIDIIKDADYVLPNPDSQQDIPSNAVIAFDECSFYKNMKNSALVQPKCNGFFPSISALYYNYNGDPDVRDFANDLGYTYNTCHHFSNDGVSCHCMYYNDKTTLPSNDKTVSILNSHALKLRKHGTKMASFKFKTRNPFTYTNTSLSYVASGSQDGVSCDFLSKATIVEPDDTLSNSPVVYMDNGDASSIINATKIDVVTDSPLISAVSIFGLKKNFVNGNVQFDMIDIDTQTSVDMNVYYIKNDQECVSSVIINDCSGVERYVFVSLDENGDIKFGDNNVVSLEFVIDGTAQVDGIPLNEIVKKVSICGVEKTFVDGSITFGRVNLYGQTQFDMKVYGELLMGTYVISAIHGEQKYLTVGLELDTTDIEIKGTPVVSVDIEDETMLATKVSISGEEKTFINGKVSYDKKSFTGSSLDVTVYYDMDEHENFQVLSLPTPVGTKKYISVTMPVGADDVALDYFNTNQFKIDTRFLTSLNLTLHSESFYRVAISKDGVVFVNSDYVEKKSALFELFDMDYNTDSVTVRAYYYDREHKNQLSKDFVVANCAGKKVYKNLRISDVEYADEFIISCIHSCENVSGLVLNLNISSPFVDKNISFQMVSGVVTIKYTGADSSIKTLLSSIADSADIKNIYLFHDVINSTTSSEIPIVSPSCCSGRGFPSEPCKLNIANVIDVKTDYVGDNQYHYLTYKEGSNLCQNAKLAQTPIKVPNKSVIDTRYLHTYDINTASSACSDFIKDVKIYKTLTCSSSQLNSMYKTASMGFGGQILNGVYLSTTTIGSTNKFAEFSDCDKIATYDNRGDATFSFVSPVGAKIEYQNMKHFRPSSSIVKSPHFAIKSSYEENYTYPNGYLFTYLLQNVDGNSVSSSEVELTLYILQTNGGLNVYGSKVTDATWVYNSIGKFKAYVLGNALYLFLFYQTMPNFKIKVKDNGFDLNPVLEGFDYKYICNLPSCELKTPEGESYLDLDKQTMNFIYVENGLDYVRSKTAYIPSTSIDASNPEKYLNYKPFYLRPRWGCNVFSVPCSNCDSFTLYDEGPSRIAKEYYLSNPLVYIGKFSNNQSGELVDYCKLRNVSFYSSGSSTLSRYSVSRLEKKIFLRNVGGSVSADNFSNAANNLRCGEHGGLFEVSCSVNSGGFLDAEIVATGSLYTAVENSNEICYVIKSDEHVCFFSSATVGNNVSYMFHKYTVDENGNQIEFVEFPYSVENLVLMNEPESFMPELDKLYTLTSHKMQVFETSSLDGMFSVSCGPSVDGLGMLFEIKALCEYSIIHIDGSPIQCFEPISSMGQIVGYRVGFFSSKSGKYVDGERIFFSLYHMNISGVQDGFSEFLYEGSDCCSSSLWINEVKRYMGSSYYDYPYIAYCYNGGTFKTLINTRGSAPAVGISTIGYDGIAIDSFSSSVESICNAACNVDVEQNSVERILTYRKDYKSGIAYEYCVVSLFNYGEEERLSLPQFDFSAFDTNNDSKSLSLVGDISYDTKRKLKYADIDGFFNVKKSSSDVVITPIGNRVISDNYGLTYVEDTANRGLITISRICFFSMSTVDYNSGFWFHCYILDSNGSQIEYIEFPYFGNGWENENELSAELLQCRNMISSIGENTDITYNSDSMRFEFIPPVLGLNYDVVVLSYGGSILTSKSIDSSLGDFGISVDDPSMVERVLITWTESVGDIDRDKCNMLIFNSKNSPIQIGSLSGKKYVLNPGELKIFLSSQNIFSNEMIHYEPDDYYNYGFVYLEFNKDYIFNDSVKEFKAIAPISDCTVAYYDDNNITFNPKNVMYVFVDTGKQCHHVHTFRKDGFINEYSSDFLLSVLPGDAPVSGVVPYSKIHLDKYYFLRSKVVSSDTQDGIYKLYSISGISSSSNAYFKFGSDYYMIPRENAFTTGISCYGLFFKTTNPGLGATVFEITSSVNDVSINDILAFTKRDYGSSLENNDDTVYLVFYKEYGITLSEPVGYAVSSCYINNGYISDASYYNTSSGDFLTIYPVKAVPGNSFYVADYNPPVKTPQNCQTMFLFTFTLTINEVRPMTNDLLDLKVCMNGKQITINSYGYEDGFPVFFGINENRNIYIYLKFYSETYAKLFVYTNDRDRKFKNIESVSIVKPDVVSGAALFGTLVRDAAVFAVYFTSTTPLFILPNSQKAKEIKTSSIDYVGKYCGTPSSGTTGDHMCVILKDGDTINPSDGTPCAYMKYKASGKELTLAPNAGSSNFYIKDFVGGKTNYYCVVSEGVGKGFYDNNNATANFSGTLSLLKEMEDSGFDFYKMSDIIPIGKDDVSLDETSGLYKLIKPIKITNVQNLNSFLYLLRVNNDGTAGTSYVYGESITSDGYTSAANSYGESITSDGYTSAANSYGGSGTFNQLNDSGDSLELSYASSGVNHLQWMDEEYHSQTTKYSLYVEPEYVPHDITSSAVYSGGKTNYETEKVSIFCYGDTKCNRYSEGENGKCRFYNKTNDSCGLADTGYQNYNCEYALKEQGQNGTGANWNTNANANTGTGSSSGTGVGGTGWTGGTGKQFPTLSIALAKTQNVLTCTPGSSCPLSTGKPDPLTTCKYVSSYPTTSVEKRSGVKSLVLATSNDNTCQQFGTSFGFPVGGPASAELCSDYCTASLLTDWRTAALKCNGISNVNKCRGYEAGADQVCTHFSIEKRVCVNASSFSAIAGENGQCIYLSTLNGSSSRCGYTFDVPKPNRGDYCYGKLGNLLDQYACDYYDTSKDSFVCKNLITQDGKNIEDANLGDLVYCKFLNLEKSNKHTFDVTCDGSMMNNCSYLSVLDSLQFALLDSNNIFIQYKSPIAFIDNEFDVKKDGNFVCVLKSRCVINFTSLLSREMDVYKGVMVNIKRGKYDFNLLSDHLTSNLDNVYLFPGYDSDLPYRPYLTKKGLRQIGFAFTVGVGPIEHVSDLYGITQQSEKPKSYDGTCPCTYFDVCELMRDITLPISTSFPNDPYDKWVLVGTKDDMLDYEVDPDYPNVEFIVVRDTLEIYRILQGEKVCVFKNSNDLKLNCVDACSSVVVNYSEDGVDKVQSAVQDGIGLYTAKFENIDYFQHENTDGIVMPDIGFGIVLKSIVVTMKSGFVFRFVFHIDQDNKKTVRVYLNDNQYPLVKANIDVNYGNLADALNMCSYLTTLLGVKCNVKFFNNYTYDGVAVSPYVANDNGFFNYSAIESVSDITLVDVFKVCNGTPSGFYSQCFNDSDMCARLRISETEEGFTYSSGDFREACLGSLYYDEFGRPTATKSNIACRSYCAPGFFRTVSMDCFLGNASCNMFCLKSSEQDDEANVCANIKSSPGGNFTCKGSCPNIFHLDECKVDCPYSFSNVGSTCWYKYKNYCLLSGKAVQGKVFPEIQDGVCFSQGVCTMANVSDGKCSHLSLQKSGETACVLGSNPIKPNVLYNSIYNEFGKCTYEYKTRPTICSPISCNIKIDLSKIYENIDLTKGFKLSYEDESSEVLIKQLVSNIAHFDDLTSLPTEIAFYVTDGDSSYVCVNVLDDSYSTEMPYGQEVYSPGVVDFSIDVVVDQIFDYDIYSSVSTCQHSSCKFPCGVGSIGDDKCTYVGTYSFRIDLGDTVETVNFDRGFKLTFIDDQDTVCKIIKKQPTGSSVLFDRLNSLPTKIEFGVFDDALEILCVNNLNQDDFSLNPYTKSFAWANPGGGGTTPDQTDASEKFPYEIYSYNPVKNIIISNSSLVDVPNGVKLSWVTGVDNSGKNIYKEMMCLDGANAPGVGFFVDTTLQKDIVFLYFFGIDKKFYRYNCINRTWFESTNTSFSNNEESRPWNPIGAVSTVTISNLKMPCKYLVKETGGCQRGECYHINSLGKCSIDHKKMPCFFEGLGLKNSCKYRMISNSYDYFNEHGIVPHSDYANTQCSKLLDGDCYYRFPITECAGYNTSYEKSVFMNDESHILSKCRHADSCKSCHACKGNENTIVKKNNVYCSQIGLVIKPSNLSALESTQDRYAYCTIGGTSLNVTKSGCLICNKYSAGENAIFCKHLKITEVPEFGSVFYSCGYKY